MFTIEAIQQAEQKVKTGTDFPRFIHEIKAMGVERNDVYVINGMSIYFGKDEHTVESAPAYETLLIEEQSSVEDLKEALKIHQLGQTDFQTFCRQAAGAGVEKWIIDLKKMTVSYLDMAGNEMLVEEIPSL
ncbi:DUF1398 domain-containing protein [Pedobacter insulae]|uniref:Uncharacterized conserved protein YbcV, DUF1398 family n=1 Tax=Pedobacter insulae TaxID=414048 RepID=A0A1I3AL94_9SPHI|nr:DUF1398 family protein [Pedobacter insulae]SFH50539.1 Uncharacterized conserved protein YbcV, DUF1398 family [Pedobacter insulae]